MASFQSTARAWLGLRVTPVTVGVIGLMVLGAALRFSTLATQSYWYDEALTFGLVNQPFADMISTVADKGEASPHLYYVLAWGWIHVFGDGEAGLRSLSALVGVLTIPVAYSAARLLVNSRVGMIVAALVATSPALIWYSQESRSYALLVFLSSLSLLFFARSRERPVPTNIAGWAISSVLALTTHYFALAVVVPEAILLLATSRERRRTAVGVGAVALGGLALAPLILHQRVHGGAGWIASTELSDRMRQAAGFFTTGIPHPGNDVIRVAAVAWLVTAGLALWRADLRTRNGALVALGLGLSAIAIPVMAALAGSDYVLDRNLLVAWLPLAVVFAAGTGARRLGAAGLVTAVLACGVFLYYDLRVVTDESLQRADWRRLARALGPMTSERVVVVAPYWQGISLTPYEPELRPMFVPRLVTAIDTVTYNGGLAWRDPLRQTRPGPPFREAERFTVQRMTVRRFRAPRPTLVRPESLRSRGKSGAAAYVTGG